tara:strand:+ start:57 stop:317 length:261 start_codon:yes stop_codon:yes gene_type:complete
MADDKKDSTQGGGPVKKGKPYQVWKLYEVKDGKLTRKNPFSPKAGAGYFMANHKDRSTCGKTYYMEKKDASKEPAKEAPKTPTENK